MNIINSDSLELSSYLVPYHSFFEKLPFFKYQIAIFQISNFIIFEKYDAWYGTVWSCLIVVSRAKKKRSFKRILTHFKPVLTRFSAF